MVLWLLQAFSGLPADELKQIAFFTTVACLLGGGFLLILIVAQLVASWQEKK